MDITKLNCSYNCHFSDVINNLNDVRQWVRPLACKIGAKTSLFEPRHEKTGFLHMRKQRRRSASR